jgi:exopolysaccharide biosynthesis polyprenyl glycosylphosphotransferase
MEVYRTCRKMGIKVRMAPTLFEAVAMEMPLGESDGIATITLGETPLTGMGLLVKDSLDRVIAGTLLILSLPLVAVISLLIKLDSRGPVLYRQERIGESGNLFTLLKFRTMRLDAETGTGPVFARENDPRCTRFGRYLRRYNLDELPQLVNVLKGEMAMVGPRPERPFFVNKFKTEIPGYLRRHVVKPGMTGWAQVHGFRGDTSVQDRVVYDIYYIENWSLWMDLGILLRTFGANRNAY